MPRNKKAVCQAQVGDQAQRRTEKINTEGTMNLKDQAERIKTEARALAIIETQEGNVEYARRVEANAIADREQQEQLLSKIMELSPDEMIELVVSIPNHRRDIHGIHMTTDIDRLAEALGIAS